MDKFFKNPHFALFPHEQCPLRYITMNSLCCLYLCVFKIVAISLILFKKITDSSFTLTHTYTFRDTQTQTHTHTHTNTQYLNTYLFANWQMSSGSSGSMFISFGRE